MWRARLVSIASYERGDLSTPLCWKVLTGGSSGNTRAVVLSHPHGVFDISGEDGAASALVSALLRRRSAVAADLSQAFDRAVYSLSKEAFSADYL